ncbi:MAG: hypothetical protein Q4D74_10040, partial [Comamonadaceae bacterium]|nr:hypothetical protein [Comamonadaceae bacterium]
ATFGAGSLAGPIGIGLVLVSAIGLGVWESIKEANKHEPGSDNGISLRFLKHAGFTEDKARELVDQSGEGYSVVPLLARYAEHKGLDLKNAKDQEVFVNWVNKMSLEDLTHIRGLMHTWLDMLDGDVEKFGATKDNDGTWDPVQEISGDHNNYWVTTTVHLPPGSAVQMDELLRSRGMETLGS